MDHARARGRAKRGGQRQRVSLELSGVADLASQDSGIILAVDDAFRRLEVEDSRAADVVRLRFYAGLNVDETARTLGISPRTVAREWTFARSWLARELMEPERGSNDEPGSAQADSGKGDPTLT